MEKIEQLVHLIEKEVYSGFQVEITSWKLGEFVMNGLKHHQSNHWNLSPRGKPFSYTPLLSFPKIYL